MGKHKPYDEEWLVAALAMGKLSRWEIARHVGLSRAQVARIAAGRIRRDFRLLSRHFDFVIVEGAGGLMVPLSRTPSRTRTRRMPSSSRATVRVGRL